MWGGEQLKESLLGFSKISLENTCPFLLFMFYVFMCDGDVFETG